jgi:hypothetical protein
MDLVKQENQLLVQEFLKKNEEFSNLDQNRKKEIAKMKES